MSQREVLLCWYRGRFYFGAVLEFARIWKRMALRAERASVGRFVRFGRRLLGQTHSVNARRYRERLKGVTAVSQGGSLMEPLPKLARAANQ